MKRSQPEAALQRACVEYLRTQERLGKLAFAHVPNGGKRGLIEAARFKALGVRAGFPDLIITFPLGQAVFVELKSDKGRETTMQQAWHATLKRLGFFVTTVRRFEELEGIVAAFTRGRPTLESIADVARSIA